MPKPNGRIPPISHQLVQAVARRVYELWLRDLERTKERQRWAKRGRSK